MSNSGAETGEETGPCGICAEAIRRRKRAVRYGDTVLLLRWKCFLVSCPVTSWAESPPPVRWLPAKQTSTAHSLCWCSTKRHCPAHTPHFMDWTLKHPEEKDTFLAWPLRQWPCLPVRVKKGKIPVTCHYMGPDMGTVHFQLKSGVVTLSTLQEDGGHFKMFVLTENPS